MPSLDIRFRCGEKVYIDDDRSIKALVIGIFVYPGVQEYKLSWWKNGDIMEAVFDGWRLSPVE